MNGAAPVAAVWRRMHAFKWESGVDRVIISQRRLDRRRVPAIRLCSGRKRSRAPSAPLLSHRRRRLPCGSFTAPTRRLGEETRFRRFCAKTHPSDLSSPIHLCWPGEVVESRTIDPECPRGGRLVSAANASVRKQNGDSARNHRASPPCPFLLVPSSVLRVVQAPAATEGGGRVRIVLSH